LQSGKPNSQTKTELKVKISLVIGQIIISPVSETSSIPNKNYASKLNIMAYLAVLN